MPVPRSFRRVVLENGLLRVEVLPELGGRVDSLFDLRFGRETLFRNPVVKPVRIPTVGAFCSGGIEFNFPLCHAPNALAPVGCEYGRQGDYAYVRIGEREPRTGMEWVVEYGLFAGLPALLQRTALRNPTPQDHPWCSWTIAAVRSTPGTEFVHPPSRVAVLDDHSRECDWPGEGPTGGLAWDRAARHMTAYAWPGGTTQAFGAFHHDLGFGLLHLADPTQLPGRKIWTFGHGPHRAWGSATTVGDDSYAEVESGPTAGFGPARPFPSRTERRSVEWWIPVGSRDAFASASFPTANLPPWPDPWLGWSHSPWQVEWETFGSGEGALPGSVIPPGLEMEMPLRRQLATGDPRAREPLALWLAFRGRPEEAYAIIEHAATRTGQRLAGLIAWQGLHRPAAARVHLEAGPLQDPFARAELDTLYADLGLIEPRRHLLERASSHRLLVERRADLALAVGEPEVALRLLESVAWPRELQRYVRTDLWRRARLALGLSLEPAPESLGEDTLYRGAIGEG